jgi:hypothetical protein
MPMPDLPTLFREALPALAATASSGRLRASTGLEEVGEVVLHHGSVAWATCAYQPEELGSFLMRLGRLSREQLFALRSEYARRGGTTKLGKLLEDGGLISRPVLRRCLLLHVRLALACMLRNPDLVAEWEQVELAAGEEVLFPLAEVMPDASLVEAEDRVAVADQAVLVRGEPFLGLAEVSGYRGTLVASDEGRLLLVHGFTDRELPEGALLAVRAISLLEAAARFSAEQRAGEVELTVVKASGGSLMTGWVDSNRRRLVATLLGSGANEGMARLRLSQALPAIRALVEAR